MAKAFSGKKPQHFGNTIRVFLNYLGRHKFMLGLVGVLTAVSALANLLGTYMIKPVVNGILETGSIPGLVRGVALTAAIYAVGALSTLGYTQTMVRAAQKVLHDIRRDLFAHMQDLGFDFYDKNRTGQLMSRLTTDLFELTELAHHGPEDVLTSSVTIIGALVVMATIRWELALVVGILVPIFLFVIMSMRSSLGSVSAGVKQKTGHINTEIESSLSGIRTAKAFGNENMEIRRFDAANEIFKTSKRAFHKAMGRFNSTMELFLTVLNVVVIAVGGYMIMQGKMDYRDLVTFSLYIATFVNPMRKLSTLSEMFANGFAGLNRFVEIMRTEPTIQDAADAKPLENVTGSIRVDHVSFTYDGTLPVLHDVSLDVAPGETVAIVGPSGGGKSTLCQLIPRFYDVTEGSISIDGQDVRHIQQHSLHKAIGIVQQDVFLFADTILENIRYGRPDATDEEVIEAAKQAEIYADIQAMPKGFQTYVGERGTLLSGGQKQRVAIARIFLMNPPILILDEATSALDSVTEAKIQRAFDNLSRGRTTLIIAHRLSTIRSANRIISISDGRITESGTHGELLQKGGVYADLYNTQNALALEALKQ
mgnify:CR=1 FL=1